MKALSNTKIGFERKADVVILKGIALLAVAAICKLKTSLFLNKQVTFTARSQIFLRTKYQNSFHATTWYTILL